ncbi:Transcription factor AP-1 [Bienertia sinuspersici]
MKISSVQLVFPSKISHHMTLKQNNHKHIPCSYKNPMQDPNPQSMMSFATFAKNISYVTFIILAIIVPILSAIFIKIPSLEDTLSYNKLLQVPESGLAFLDVQRGYKFEVDKAFRILHLSCYPLFFVVPMNSIMFVTGLASWVYRTGVFLLARGSKEYARGGFGSQPDAIFREHVRIKDQLYVTSQRFRFFIVGCLVIITVSQLGALLLVLASKSKKTSSTLVSSAVETEWMLLMFDGGSKNNS